MQCIKMISYSHECAGITHITGVDKPRYFPIRRQFPVHVTPQLAVLPAVIDVHYSHHVPLNNKKNQLI